MSKHKLTQNTENTTEAKAPTQAGQVLESLDLDVLRMPSKPPPNNAEISYMQRKLGNRTVSNLLQRKIMRQEEEGEEEEEPIDTSGLGMQEKLPGHGNLGSFSPVSSVSLPGIQREGGSGVTANITLTSNPPSYDSSKTAAQIAAAHGRAGVAGWTTPSFGITVPSANSKEVTIVVTMDYAIELASDYSGDRLAILQDHENGHVDIGNTKAQTHLVDEVKSNLESNSSLSRAVIQGVLTAAGATFRAEESTESQSYDTSDYPRMQQAYLGARTPLADLETGSANIAAAATALRNFNSSASSANRTQLENLAQAVIDGSNNLTADELAQLQYNRGFKSLVSACNAKITEVFERQHEETQAKLETLRQTLGGFTWSSPYS